jgi:hypothetical protein
MLFVILKIVIILKNSENKTLTLKKIIYVPT